MKVATTVKVMLNDQAAIEELVKDPETQILVKNAIVDAVAKRAAKAAQAALDSTIESAVEIAMARFLKGKPNDIVKRCDVWNHIVLSDKMMKAIQDAVDAKLTIAAFDYAGKFPENDQLRKAIQRQIDYVSAIDVEKRLASIIEKVVREKFGGK